jgi:hypothetical protein
MRPVVIRGGRVVDPSQKMDGVLDVLLADGTPWLGNQTTDLTGGAFVEIPVGDTSEQLLSIVGGAGFTKRNRSYSNQLPYSFDFRVHRPAHVTGLIGRVGVFGVIPLSTDPLKGVPLASLTSMGSGGSFITGSTAASRTVVPSDERSATGTFQLCAGSVTPAVL